MPLSDELKAECDQIFSRAWKERTGSKVPDETDLTFANDGINVEGAVLYADLAESTSMVDLKTKTFAAEVYKSFLHCSAKVIRSEGGTITAYDGDRIMAVWLNLSSDAVRAALKINWVAKFIIQPALNSIYGSTGFTLRHTCGIDYSPLMVAKAGVRGANDLVWVGQAANYAAKLSNLSPETPTWITDTVYSRLLDDVRFGGNPRRDMWQRRAWTPMRGQTIYCSDFWWSFK